MNICNACMNHIDQKKMINIIKIIEGKKCLSLPGVESGAKRYHGEDDV